MLPFRKQLSPVSRMWCPLPVSYGEEAKDSPCWLIVSGNPPCNLRSSPKTGIRQNMEVEQEDVPWVPSCTHYPRHTQGSSISWLRDSLEKGFPRQSDSFIWILLYYRARNGQRQERPGLQQWFLFFVSFTSNTLATLEVFPLFQWQTLIQSD